MLRDTDLIIGDDNYTKFIGNVVHDGEQKKFGLIPRDYSKHPVGSYANSFLMRDVRDVPMIAMEEWPERIKERERTGSQMSQIRLKANGQGGPIPSLDQDGYGYCWNHSTTSSLIILRMMMNLPYVRLSAFAIGSIIKNFVDEGGWGAQSMDFCVSGFTRNGRKYLGVPSVEFWPEKSTNRALATDDRVWQNAALHVVTEGFIDVEAAQYDRDLSAQQVGSLLLQDIPVVCDYNWWGHSVCGIDLVDVYPDRPARDIRRYGVRILNSWRDSWGELGTGVLKDSKAFPDGAVAPRAMKVSMA